METDIKFLIDSIRKLNQDNKLTVLDSLRAIDCTGHQDYSGADMGKMSVNMTNDSKENKVIFAVSKS